MATKADEVAGLERGTGILARCADDEPIFILRAQDATAPDAVRCWARQLELITGITPKVAEAYDLANDMETWQDRTGRGKQPD